ncbi:hypothetical protein [Mycobacterium branderi]|uniref:hypothetical protein n=1 Tax=Mycobacterium branderi TaxID=43348 RepID=UPI0013D69BE5|nr:hypothetical protein [Mycobacterium branderi]MCV7231539.1 hypothetical protein [Mycobacterium branderi]
MASQIVATQPTVDDDIVEALHHRRLVEHRQLAQFDWAIDTSDAFAVIRRVHHREPYQLVEPFLLKAKQLLPRPPLLITEAAGKLCG